MKKYIAILLFGILFFPIAYQPWHVLKHHSQNVFCFHDCLHSNNEHEDSSKTALYTASEELEPCPICNYHFPINVLPKILYYQGNNAVTESSITDLGIRLPHQQVISVKTPRAPPAKT